MSKPVTPEEMREYVNATWGKCQGAAWREPLTDREQKIILFAVHRFMHDAYAQTNAAAQDRENRHFKLGAVDAFYRDAKDAEVLIAKLKEKNT